MEGKWDRISAPWPPHTCVVFVLGGWDGLHLHMGRCTGSWMHIGEYPVVHIAPTCDDCGEPLADRTVVGDVKP